MSVPNTQTFAREAAAIASTLTRPTITVSTRPSNIVLSWVAATGMASEASLRASARTGDIGASS
jgi:hypothetical protein